MFKNTKKHIDITFGDVIHLPSTEITICKYFKRNNVECCCHNCEFKLKTMFRLYGESGESSKNDSCKMQTSTI